MPVAPDDSALVVSLAEFQRAAQRSLKGDVSEDDTAEEWAQALEDAQETVEGYTGRSLLVARHEQRFVRCDIRTRHPSPTEVRYDLYAAHGPVVEVVNADALLEDERITVGPDGQLVLGSEVEMPGTAEYFAGWRGRHHELAALQALDGLDTLTVLPPVVPADLRRAIVKLGLVYVTQARAGLLGGVGSYQRIAGGTTVDVQKADPNAEENALKAIRHHRRQLVGV